MLTNQLHQSKFVAINDINQTPPLINLKFVLSLADPVKCSLTSALSSDPLILVSIKFFSASVMVGCDVGES